MDFITSIKTGFKKYVDFNGRASRSEYWWWQLFATGSTLILSTVIFAISLGIGFIVGLLCSIIPPLTPVLTLLSYAISMILTILQCLLPLALLLPSWAVFVRRLHDTGYNGWWALLIRASNIFCFIGLIIEIVFACLQSVPEENEYGPVPAE